MLVLLLAFVLVLLHVFVLEFVFVLVPLLTFVLWLAKQTGTKCCVVSSRIGG